MARNKPTRQIGAAPGQLRIIGGEWRGRKLSFRAAPGLRPTTDRIRETLFNWLAPELAGARCIDLFAGSGALGLEALSRGAEHCTFIDTNRAALDDIGGHLERLSASERGCCQCRTASEFLATADNTCDVIFVDPPFSAGLVEETLGQLAQSACVGDRTLVYLETGADEPLAPLPRGWSVHRDKRSGGVSYRLLTTTAAP